MNKIEVYMYLCYASFALCILFVVIASALFFYYDIPSVIGYLTGHRAKKRIQKIERETVEGGKTSGKMRTSEQSKKKRTTETRIDESPKENKALSPSEDSEQTEEIKKCESQEEFDETTALQQIDFVIEREVLLVHTEEII